MELGRTLRRLREEKKLQQKEVAAMFQLSNGTMANYENDVHSPKPDMLVKLADLYDVSLDYLLGRCSDRNHPYKD